MSNQHFKALPKPHTTYANIIKSLLPIGDSDKADKTVLPEATYTVDTLEIDHENLTDYRKICGFKNNGLVPPTYFAVLSQALQMNMMVKEPFPFVMLGLVHVENSVTQHCPISEDSEFTLSVSLANLRDHDKGKQFDFITRVHEKDELVWEGTSTYLSRQKSKKTQNRAKTPTEPTEKPTLDENDMRHLWEIPEDLGRRYAFVSGDFNLIHLHPLSARAFGFPKAIAHGMWSKAKCLAELGELPAKFRCDVSFKLPIFLPSEVEFIAKYDNRDEHIDFGVYDVSSSKPHVIGLMTDLTNDKKTI